MQAKERVYTCLQSLQAWDFMSPRSRWINLNRGAFVSCDQGLPVKSNRAWRTLLCEDWRCHPTKLSDIEQQTQMISWASVLDLMPRFYPQRLYLNERILELNTSPSPILPQEPPVPAGTVVDDTSGRHSNDTVGFGVDGQIK